MKTGRRTYEAPAILRLVSFCGKDEVLVVSGIDAELPEFPDNPDPWESGNLSKPHDYDGVWDGKTYPDFEDEEQQPWSL